MAQRGQIAAKDQIARNGAGAQSRQLSSRAHENKGLGKGEIVNHQGPKRCSREG